MRVFFKRCRTKGLSPTIPENRMRNTIPDVVVVRIDTPCGTFAIREHEKGIQVVLDGRPLVIYGSWQEK